MAHQGKKTAFIILFLANLGIILAAWWSISGATFLSDQHGMLLALGRLTGLLAASLVLVQFFLIGRVRFLEQAFGHDSLARVHASLGFFTLLCILAHPLFLAASYATGVSSTFPTLIQMIFSGDELAGAGVSVLVFLIAGSLSIKILRARLSYEIWYRTHLLFYLAAILAFSHQYELGTELSNPLFGVYFGALYVIGVGSLVLFRFLIPLYRLSLHQFRVERVTRENENVVTITMTGKALKRLPHKPGQFIIVRFLSPGFWSEAHPFSISHLDEKHLAITVKAIGDYTERLPTIRPGAYALIDGPHGTFTLDHLSSSRQRKVLLIAGGIGITPVKALYEACSRRGLDCTLLYANRTKEDILFAKELKETRTTRTVHILSHEPAWKGERGFVNEEFLDKQVKDLRDRDVYLCGPPSMIKALRKTLRKKGVRKDHIHYELFAL